MEIFAIIVLSLATVLLGYTTYNMLQKVEAYEDFIDIEIRKNQQLLETLKRLDAKQMFEKDDEVGSVFEQIKESIIRLKQIETDASKKTK
jgi:nitrate reductase assembly molybdenum cofactor insertion protein NarJ